MIRRGTVLRGVHILVATAALFIAVSAFESKHEKQQIVSLHV